METVIATLITKLESSGVMSLTLSFAILIVGGWLYFRKTNIEEVTSVGTLQQQQIESLLKQIEYLSSELKQAREQLHEIHEQNYQLMKQVRESNLRIQELERILDARKEI